MGPTLAQVVKRVESRDGQAQLRWELDCYKALELGQAKAYALNPQSILDTIIRVNACTLDTADIIFSSSWGLYQDMGFEIYGELCMAPSHVPTIWEWLEQPGMQDLAFARWCESRDFDALGALPDDAGLARFAALYNGPGNVLGYVAMLNRAAQSLTQAA